jgi:hypothetical protein
MTIEDVRVEDLAPTIQAIRSANTQSASMTDQWKSQRQIDMLMGDPDYTQHDSNIRVESFYRTAMSPLLLALIPRQQTLRQDKAQAESLTKKVIEDTTRQIFELDSELFGGVNMDYQSQVAGSCVDDVRKASRKMSLEQWSASLVKRRMEKLGLNVPSQIPSGSPSQAAESLFRLTVNPHPEDLTTEGSTPGPYQVPVELITCVRNGIFGRWPADRAEGGEETGVNRKKKKRKGRGAKDSQAPESTCGTQPVSPSLPLDNGEGCCQSRRPSFSSDRTLFEEDDAESSGNDEAQLDSRQGGLGSQKESASFNRDEVLAMFAELAGNEKVDVYKLPKGPSVSNGKWYKTAKKSKKGVWGTFAEMVRKAEERSTSTETVEESLMD